jgi:hypothetical protein
VVGSSYALPPALFYPPSPDGLSDIEAAPVSDGKTQKHSSFRELVEGIKGQVKRGSPIDFTPSTIISDSCIATGFSGNTHPFRPQSAIVDAYNNEIP